MGDDVLSQPITLNRPDGSTLTFTRCAPADRLAFRAIFRQYRKVWLRQSLEVLGINGDAAVDHFNRFDRLRLLESDVVRWLNEPEGQYEAILLSMRKDKPQATIDDALALDLDTDERLTVAAGVMNIPIVVESKGGQQNSFPSGTETGAENVPSSDTTDTQTP